MHQLNIKNLKKFRDLYIIYLIKSFLLNAYKIFLKCKYIHAFCARTYFNLLSMYVKYKVLSNKIYVFFTNV